ncbi:MAG: ribonuclease E activity regulator RraA [Acidiferrobacterales bacterium]
MTQATTDISDALGDAARVAAPIFSDYGGRKVFSGQIATVKCLEDNSLVRQVIEEAGEGRVLVVDGGGSTNCALLGDMLAALAHRNGWAGIVVNGCIRDSAEIDNIDIGVKALATHPRKSRKQGLGERDIPVDFAGIEFKPGEYLYADQDGVVVTAEPVPFEM